MEILTPSDHADSIKILVEAHPMSSLLVGLGVGVVLGVTEDSYAWRSFLIENLKLRLSKALNQTLQNSI